MTVDNIPHGLEGYRRYKCTCVRCKKANAQYSREVRARAKAKKLEEVSDNVRPLRSRRGNSMNTVVGGDVLNGRAKAGQERLSDEPEQPGLVEQGVIAVCENNPVADERPDVVAQARRLAIFMDTPTLQKDYPSCSRQLSNLMQQLRPAGKSKSRGRLVAVQRLTNRRPAGSDDRASGR